MTIVGPVVLSVPINENSNGTESHIRSNNHVSEEDPRGDDSFVLLSWWSGERKLLFY